MSAFTDWLGNVNVGNLSQGLLGAAGYKNLMSDLGNIGQQANTGAQELGRQAVAGTTFKPYTVTTGSGAQMGYGADGNINMQLGANEQALQNQLMGQAQGMFGAAGQDVGARTQDIYGNMAMAMQPQQQRDQLAMEQRMAAQGRLGLSSNMYGGANPDMFNMAKAQQEANNNAYMAARAQAMGEQGQMGTLGTQMLTGSYMPQAQLLNAMQQGTAVQELADLGRRQGAQLQTEAGMAGLDALLQSQLGAANLGGQGLAALAAMLGGSSISSNGTTVSGGLTLGDVGGMLSSGWDWLSGYADIANQYGTNPYSQQTQMLAQQEQGM